MFVIIHKFLQEVTSSTVTSFYLDMREAQGNNSIRLLEQKIHQRNPIFTKRDYFKSIMFD